MTIHFFIVLIGKVRLFTACDEDRETAKGRAKEFLLSFNASSEFRARMEFGELKVDLSSILEDSL